ncbi:hypothetical protein LCGC14_2951740 [marine sediment metagenome]|uniref:Uncharacterized protein n=1 Tax=marine sediment metagenome TaxID=412755 RepID=A0A0F8XET6_9ZZZZ
MDYQILTENEQDNIKVSFLLSQERDAYCHGLNLERYDAMLETLDDGDWKLRVTKLRAETAGRLAEVSSIITATLPQMPSSQRIQAAKLRLETATAAARTG